MLQALIRRPVTAIVIAIFITIFGLLALIQLPIAQFPNVTPPEVNVTVEFTGANAETVTKSALIPLERAINGIPGMKYMSSDAGNDGVGVIQIIFETGTDPDIAAVNVQNRVATVTGDLPPEVIKAGIKIAKEENAMLMYLDVYSKDTTQDEKFLYNFVDINVIPELKRLEGIGAARIMGVKQYAMRVWLKPDNMLAYQISASDVQEALRSFNLEAAPGKIGDNSDKSSNPLQYVLNYTGRFTTEEQFGNIPIRSSIDGSILRIRDIADLEFGTLYFDVEAKLNGMPSAAIMIKQLPGSNAKKVITGIKAKLAELKEKRFVQGMDYQISYDVSRFLDASIYEVIKTLIEAFILVSLVVFIFLQNWRLTLIPALAVPVSIIGTFAFIQLLGFSLNMVTLFSLVLAIGIVIDDAIVVVEAVHAKMELEHLSPLAATQSAVREIGGAIVSITLVMSAVFIPTAFMSGPVGIFYGQFCITMAIAIVLSGVTALTLTPALCTLILKPHQPSAPNLFFRAFNQFYDRLAIRYGRSIGFFIHRRFALWGSLVLFIVLTAVLTRVVPSGFIPNEDQGTFYASITTPPGSTLERTKSVVNAITQLSQTDSTIQSTSTLAGTNVLTDGTGATYGACIFNLVDWNKRDKSVDEVMDELADRAREIKDAKIDFFPPPAVPGYGNAGGFELRLLDKSNSGDFLALASVLDKFIAALGQAPELTSVFSVFEAKYPQYVIHIDYDKAAQKGLSPEAILSEVQSLVGSEYVTNFIRFGQTYKVMLQALPSYRSEPDDLLKYYVKNNEGELVQLANIISIQKKYGLDQLTRYNMYPSAEITGDTGPGFSSSQSLKTIQRIAAEQLPRSYDIDWAGISRDEINFGNQDLYVFLICFIFVYLILSAQYESFVIPFAIICAIPLGMFGALFFLYISGLQNNIYAQIAIIMLIGLLGKNAILVAEYVIAKTKTGESLIAATREGAIERLRPILMTSFAFIVGLLPLVFSGGAGAMGNRTIGTAAAGGMLIGTLVGLLLIPGFVYYFIRLSQNRKDA
jgi:hydrophobic/amphiphilic exporter-1 (mainly G- bacteria), HAE1 family